jgi:hypothetical protein
MAAGCIEIDRCLLTLEGVFVRHVGCVLQSLRPERTDPATLRLPGEYRPSKPIPIYISSMVPASAVHQARKALKARAGLRMLRPCVKEAIYREVNKVLRDAARPLSAARDAQVLGRYTRRPGSPLWSVGESFATGNAAPCDCASSRRHAATAPRKARGNCAFARAITRGSSAGRGVGGRYA